MLRNIGIGPQRGANAGAVRPDSMASEPLADELVRILQAAEMRGEHAANTFRIGFYLLSAAMLGASLSINTELANQGFIAQVGTMLVYSALVFGWFRTQSNRFAPWLKYVSITIDMAALHAGAWIMAQNHHGIMEYFHSFVPLVLVFWHILAAIRLSVAACIYSGVVSLIMSSTVLFVAANYGGVEISEVSVWGRNAINLADESTRVVMISLPAFASAYVAHVARGLIIRAEQESQQRARLEQQKEQLSKYLSKELTDAVLEHPEMFQLGGTRRNATILFSDIRNFTPLAENTEPEQVVQLLNEYFTEMVSIVFRYGGTLDKFLGDGLMAVFGAPFDLEDQELRAILVAIEMVDAVSSFNERHKLEERGLPRLNIGVGIASGPIVAGNIGSPERMEYTAIGDTVNFAARLESLNKALGTSIIVSEATHAVLDPGLNFRPLPPLKVKGKRGTPPLFALNIDQVDPGTIARLRASILDQEAAQAAR